MGSTVLVVEDNPIFRATAIDMLETLGLKAFGAHSGESALGMIEAHPEIRLVFIDIRMPGMSGPDLAQRVRRRHPAMQIIMTSGYVAEDDAPQTFRSWRSPGGLRRSKEQLRQLRTKHRTCIDAYANKIVITIRHRQANLGMLRVA